MLKGAYRDGRDADSGEHLFDQSVAVVERLHHQTLLSGHLRKHERKMLRFKGSVHGWKRRSIKSQSLKV